MWGFSTEISYNYGSKYIIIIIIIITLVYLKQKFVPMFIIKIYGGAETQIHSLLISTLR
jgi:hypothetical protein